MEAPKSFYSVCVEDYLEGERDATIRYEYIRGEVYAMAGGSDVHNTIGLNIVVALSPSARRKGCRVYASDMKVRTADDVFYYPDVMFVCEDGPDPYYKDKPCIIVEVTSPTTVRTDFSEKRYAYEALPSLLLYLVADSRRRFVTGYYRGENGWEEKHFGEGDTVPVPCAEVSLTVEDIYIQTPYQ